MTVHLSYRNMKKDKIKMNPEEVLWPEEDKRNDKITVIYAVFNFWKDFYKNNHSVIWLSSNPRSCLLP